MSIERLRQIVGGWPLNVALRGLLVAFAAEAARAGDDPRFVGKGISVRNLILAGTGLVLPMPILHRMRRPGQPYPVEADSLVLSIMVLDMAGNSLNLYERRGRFDLIPHSYGPFAGVATLRAVGVGFWPAAAIVNATHVLLEIQEALGDRFLGTRNVHGWWDTISDLGAGLFGSVGVPLALERIRARGDVAGDAAHRSYSAA